MTVTTPASISAEYTAIMRLRCALIAALAVGCGGSKALDDASNDARVDADLGCVCCTRIPIIASDALSVVSDDTSVFVHVKNPNGTHVLAEVSSNGDLNAIASADDFVLSTATGVLAYVKRMNTDVGQTFEIHVRTNGVDRLLATKAGAFTPVVAATETDVYALGSDTADQTELWRWSIAAADPTPTVVASIQGSPAYFALGATIAAVSTSTTNVTVGLPGPSTPVPTTISLRGSVFANDSAYVLSDDMQTSRSATYELDRVLPDHAVLYQSPLVTFGGAFGLRADASHLYWRESSGTEDSSGYVASEVQWLTRASLDGQNREPLCNWSSFVLEEDATGLYGVERLSSSQWVIDILPKP